MSFDHLYADVDAIENGGNQFLDAALNLPQAPPPFVPTGTDPLSAAIAAESGLAEKDIYTQLPPLHSQSQHTASNIVGAAQDYRASDQQIGAHIDQQMQNTPIAASSGSGGAASAPGVDSMGQMSQFMSMPMQMAQAPMQAISSVTSTPQGLMQGVQGAMRQFSQFGTGSQADQGGASAESIDLSDTGAEQPSGQDAREDNDRDDDKLDEGATRGETSGGRAPTAGSEQEATSAEDLRSVNTDRAADL